MQYIPDSKKKPKKEKQSLKNRFLSHSSVLIWKCYLQRQRRWGILVAEAVFALLLFSAAILIAKPVFLTPLQAEPQTPLATSDVLRSFRKDNVVGFAPHDVPHVKRVMKRAAKLLRISNVWSAPSEDILNEMLYSQANYLGFKRPIIWVIWKPTQGNIWALTIRSTERARYIVQKTKRVSNPHLETGFLAVQLAISQAIIEQVSVTRPNYKVTLVAMPVSPLMEEERVIRALTGILLCFTLALMPPVLETESLVVTETMSNFKRGLRMRNVQYSAMYIGWLMYAYLTCFPICLLASVTLILIFRWIHLVEALIVVLAYESVMIMLAMLMSMFNRKGYIACTWTILFTLMQTYLAVLLVHHRYDRKHTALTFFLHLILPPMGLVHAFNKFALLQIEHTKKSSSSPLYVVASWTLMNVLYFAFLMLLQRTIGQRRAIGGQVSWKSIIFKEAEDSNELRRIQNPTRSEFGKVQEVDELVAKAISFRDVSKTIMGVSVLKDITFDIYRGEFTIMLASKIQETMMNAIEDLLTGLMAADTGSITVLGKILKPGPELMTTPQMMGYCHRSETLIEDLTVQEHLTMYSDICLWNQTQSFTGPYCYVRSKRVLKECDLESVKHEQVRNLNLYYKAQLCWAIAMFLEPRIIVIPEVIDLNCYSNVIQDKIMQYKTYITIVSFKFASQEFEYADRVFLFDNKILIFGGTPAFMFFRYGRDYRARMTLRSSAMSEEQVKKLLDRVELAGAKVRAHLGSLIILQLPVSPSERVAELMKDLNEHDNIYGLTSFDISVADSEEVCQRAIAHFSATQNPHDVIRSTEALKNFTEHVKWKRRTNSGNLHLAVILKKFLKFHKRHIKLFSVTFISAVLSGLFLGYSLSSALRTMDVIKIPRGEFQTLSVEHLEILTTLVLRADTSSTSQSIASGYVMSDTEATEKEIKHMKYTALPHTESLTEYLATRAIDSPQIYVYMYAYGMDVSTRKKGKIKVQALYSPIHNDRGAAARSLARVYMALIRHYTGKLDATIKIVDDPLVLDISLWVKEMDTPPLFIQFLLILTNSHITLIPSHEHGLIRHVQQHAMNFSPFRYWFTLYICDLLLYWILVTVMSSIMILIMFLTVPISHFVWIDLFIVPFMLSVFGIGCIPHAYIFSLGPQIALNTMTFIIINLMFGEVTVMAKIFYGDALSYIMDLMTLSPQFNMAYAYVKIEHILMYNNECSIFEKNNLCSVLTFHKCCKKCGVMQECFSRRSYFTGTSGIFGQMSAMFIIATCFMMLLLLIEYKIFQRLWNFTTFTFANRDKPSSTLSPGALSEKEEVLDKRLELLNPQRHGKVNTFGANLLITNLTKRQNDVYMVHNVYLGIGKGEAVAVSGLQRHGRSMLCKILAGYQLPCAGNVWSMSKNKLRWQPHKYSQQVTISCDKNLLPQWLRLREALALMATLRGVPHSNIPEEVHNLIEALELHSEANDLISEISWKFRTRLQFAAAVIGAPPVIVLDDCTAYQRYSVRRAMYFILNTLRKRGHAVVMSSGSIESHMPVTNRLAIMVDGTFFDVDTVDNLVERYSERGYTVVVHLKDEVDINVIFANYFTNFKINDTTEVLVNVQVQDPNLTWAEIFEKMEALKAENREVYSYIVTGLPIDYIYNSVIKRGSGVFPAKGLISWKLLKQYFFIKSEISPEPQALQKLLPLEGKYDITKLKELPWSVIFHR